MNKLYTIILLLPLSISNCFAQLNLQCNGRDKHSIYLISKDDDMVYRIDSVDNNPSILKPVQSVPDSALGISINPNFDSISGITTMYLVDLIGQYYFWNGAGWSNSGHTSGHKSAVNIGGTTNYIFSLRSNPNACDIFRYDGTSNGTYLTTIPGSTITADIATDSLGNFYLYHFIDDKIVSYTPFGIPIDSFTVTGSAPNSFGGFGFALLGNKFYYDDGYGLHKGTIIGDTVDFSLIVSHPNTLCNDIAACPTAGFPVATFEHPEKVRFIVYPNPTNDFAKLTLFNASIIKVHDSLGRNIQEYSVDGLGEFILDVRNLYPDIYFITAISKDNHFSTHKLVVQ